MRGRRTEEPPLKEELVDVIFFDCNRTSAPIFRMLENSHGKSTFSPKLHRVIAGRFGYRLVSCIHADWSQPASGYE
jgi:hypothetical protein